MPESSPGIVADGERRLRKAIETQVRREHEQALSAAADDSQKAAIEEKIKQAIKERMKRVASPHSLWSSQLIAAEHRVGAAPPSISSLRAAE